MYTFKLEPSFTSDRVVSSNLRVIKVTAICRQCLTFDLPRAFRDSPSVCSFRHSSQYTNTHLPFTCGAKIDRNRSIGSATLARTSTTVNSMPARVIYKKRPHFIEEPNHLERPCFQYRLYINILVGYIFFT